MLRVQLAGGEERLTVSGGVIKVSGERCEGDPTNSTVSSIVVKGTPSTDALSISMSDGKFQPGAGSEPEGVSEIEISVDLGSGADELEVVGSSDPDRLRVGASGIGLNVDQDVDVTMVGVETISIRSGGGDDVVSGGGGNAADSPTSLPLTVSSGPGADTVGGGSGADVLRGGADADSIHGGDGDDVVVGGLGDDAVSGGEGDDELAGGDGTDSVHGRGGTDALDGGAGPDDLCAGGGQAGDTFDPATCEVIPVRAYPDHASAVAAGPTVQIAPLANDAGQPPLSIVSIDDTGTEGSVDDNGDGTVDYSAADALESLPEGEQADDTFEYTMTGLNAPAPSSATVTVTVTGVNDAPVAEDDTATTDEDSTSTIDALSNDDDPDSDAVLTITSAGDPDDGGSVDVAGDGSSVEFDPGDDFQDLGPTESRETAFDYTVEDDHGVEDTATVTVTVTGVDDAPTADDDAATIDEDADASAVDVLANDDDVDGDAITIQSATAPAHGAVVLTGGTAGAHTGLTYEPNADYCNDPPGTTLDTFTYTVNGGDSATVSITVTCDDDSPVAVDDDASVTEDDPATTIDVLANDTDVDGGPLSITGVTQPANGTVVVAVGDDELTYEPDADFCTTGDDVDSFTYTVNGGDTATVAVSVTCVNDQPVANDDTKTVNEDTLLSPVPVRANDTDVEGDPITIASATEPSHGQIVLFGGTEGAHLHLAYVPDPQYCNDPPGSAPDTFEYTINGGSTATVSMTVTCIDDAPVAVNDSATVTEDDPATPIDVRANDTDIDAGPKTVASATQPANGTVVLTGGTAGAHTGLTYAPNANYCNTPPGTTPDTFTYQLNGGSSATVSVSVTCVDDTPVAVNDSATVLEDASATAVTVLTNDTDIDGGPKVIASATQPANGTVVLTGGTAGAHTGLTYAPNANYCNNPPGTTPDTFTYTLNGGSSATVSVTVTCVDDSPVAVNNSTTVTEDDPATPIDVLANDTDIDGGPMVIASRTQPANGNVVLTGGTAGAHTGLTYQPNANYCNDPPGTTPDTFTYTLNGGSSATVSVTVTCVDDNPVAVNNSATVLEDASASAIDVLANDTDVDGGPKAIASSTQPANGTVVLTGGTAGAHTGLTYAPNANYCNNPPGTTPDTFTYTLNGGSTATVSMTVTCVDDNPVAVNDSATVLEDASATAVTVLTNDTDIDGGPKTISSRTQPANGNVVLTGGTAGAHTGLTYAPNANYCNNPPGTTPDTFTYTLNGGSTATVSMTVTCVDDNPVAVNDSATVLEDAAATAVTVLTNDTDIDGGPKSINSVTQPANGTVVITGGGTGLTYAPNANYCNDPPGTTPDTFTYTLNGGSSATVSMTVTCVDDNPVAVNDSSTVAEDDPATAIDVRANDTDVDGGAKLIDTVVQPANGTVVITGGGTGLTYAPNANYCNNPPGTTLDTFTYELNGGSEATVSVTVDCVDDAPLAADDSTTVAEDSGASAVDVLANDDIDGGPISIASVTQPADGTVVITGGGSGLTYEPDLNYCNDPPGSAPDTFDYTLAVGGTATVSVDVTCVDDAPTAVDDSATVTEDDPATPIDVLANDVDIELDTISISSTTDPANGTVVITGGGSGLTYEPDPGYCNNPPGGTPDTFDYTINGGDTATVSMEVTCVP